MSQENVEVVKAIQPTGVDLVEYFRDLPTAIAAGQGAAPLFADDVEVVFIPASDPGPRLSFTGVQGIRDGWQDWLAAWETYQVENERYIDAGDEVVVLSQVHARTSHQAVPMTGRWPSKPPGCGSRRERALACSEIGLVGAECANEFVDRDSRGCQRHGLEAIEVPLVRAWTGAPYNLAGPAGGPRFLHRQALIAGKRPIRGESLMKRHARTLPRGRSP